MKALEEGLIDFGMENYNKGVSDTLNGLLEGLEDYSKLPDAKPELASMLRYAVEAMKTALEEKRKCRQNQTSATSKVQ